MSNSTITPRSGRKTRRDTEEAEGGAQRPRRTILLSFFVVGLFCVMMWGFMHRSLVHVDSQIGDSSPPLSYSGGKHLDQPDPKHVQMLLDETKALLKDVIDANLTLNHAVLADLNKIQEERVNVHTDLKQIHNAHKEAAADLSACTSERLLLMEELEKHKGHTRDLQMKLDSLALSSSSSHTTTSTTHEHEVELPVPQHHAAIKDEHDAHHEGARESRESHNRAGGCFSESNHQACRL